MINSEYVYIGVLWNLNYMYMYIICIVYCDYILCIYMYDNNIIVIILELKKFRRDKVYIWMIWNEIGLDF